MFRGCSLEGIVWRILRDDSSLFVSSKYDLACAYACPWSFYVGLSQIFGCSRPFLMSFIRWCSMWYLITFLENYCTHTKLYTKDVVIFIPWFRIIHLAYSSCYVIAGVIRPGKFPFLPWVQESKPRRSTKEKGFEPQGKT